jgi:hypothetical protein
MTMSGGVPGGIIDEAPNSRAMIPAVDGGAPSGNSTANRLPNQGRP